MWKNEFEHAKNLLALSQYEAVYGTEHQDVTVAMRTLVYVENKGT